MSTTSSSTSKLAPENWVEVITEILRDEDVPDTPICIYKVPQILRDMKPEAYTPQFIGLGPYHHWCEDLYGMEPFKLIASKTSQKICHGCQNDDEAVERLGRIVKQFVKHDVPNVRASYDRNLGVEADPLAWMMVIDSIFLLEFLQVFMVPNKSCLKDPKRTCWLIDQYQSAYHSILKDIMKLENQIPIFVLKKVMSYSSDDIAPLSLLPKLLLATCEKLSPFKTQGKTDLKSDITKYNHLLGILYDFTVVPDPVNSNDEKVLDDHKNEPLENKDQGRFRKCFFSIVKMIQLQVVIKTLYTHLLRVFSNSCKPLKVIAKMIGFATEVFPSVTSCSSLKQKGLSSTDLEKGGNFSSIEGAINKEAPTIEEIVIPSVSELLGVGIEFMPIDGPVTSVMFDKMSRKFHLPKITIDDNTEVIIRNLVAYEAQAISGPAFLARYTELMNGIIDTPEDVFKLRERGIIVHCLKKDEDVAQLWNGMSRSIRLSYVPSMDKAIKEVNEYYENITRVKLYKITKECMLCGWKIVMLLLALMVMVLMAIQSFCDVYKCPRVLGQTTTQGGSNMKQY